MIRGSNFAQISKCSECDKIVPLRPSHLPDSGGIFTLSNGLHMKKISRSVCQAKQAKNLVLTVPVRTVRTVCMV
jgi:hypothetical protein